MLVQLVLGGEPGVALPAHERPEGGVGKEVLKCCRKFLARRSCLRGDKFAKVGMKFVHFCPAAGDEI